MPGLARGDSRSKACDTLAMDSKLAEIMAQLAAERRGRGWRVPPRLKRLVVSWVRSERAKKRTWSSLSKTLGVAAHVLARWSADVQVSGQSPKPSPKLRQRQPRLLALRPVQVAALADDAHASSHALQPRMWPAANVVDDSASRGLRREAVHTVLIAHGLDIEAIAALTRTLARRDSC